MHYIDPHVFLQERLYHTPARTACGLTRTDDMRVSDSLQLLTCSHCAAAIVRHFADADEWHFASTSEDKT